MKTSRRTITFFSFFPVAALLATPLMFSTLAPASNDFWTAEDVDDFSFAIPQSQLVLEEELGAGDARNGDIGEVKFLQYDRDYIYMAEDGETDVNSDAADFRNEPAITDSGEVDTAYVLQNPEFQRQVEEVSAQAQQAGAAMPPLLTLVALFAFAMATGSATLKEFFKFSTYTEKVKKTIQVTKKVAKTVYKTITETVARKVKTIKQVAYTAYETNVVQVTPPPSRDKLYELAYFMRVNFVQNLSSFSRPFQRDARYYLPNMSNEREWDDFKAEYDGIASGRKVERTVLKLQEYFSSPAHTNVGRSFNTISDYFFEGIQFTEPALYKKLKKEFDTIVKPVTDPVVNSTGKPYTAYRDEVETKTVYDTISREVPETIYEDVVEDREITEDVTKYAFTPLNEKIDLAMGYLKNYSRILQSPSNRNFSDEVLTPNKDLPFFAGAATVYNNLQAELKMANIYNVDRTHPEEVKRLLKRHNEFIYSMKGILTKIQKGQTPEEQMGILFGREYADSMKESENAVAQAEADEKALTARFNEIEELLRTNKISIGYYRSLYSSAKQNRNQLYRRKRDAVKNLKEGKEFYARKFNATVSSLQNLSFLRNLDDWRRTLAQGERSISSRLVPFTTANGSVIYRRANAPTTTQAEPKQTLPKTQPQNLQTAGFWNRVKGLFGKGTAEIGATTQAQTKQFLEYDRNTSDEYINTHMEEMILDRVNRNFPIKNLEKWRWDMGSGFHSGTDFYAVDLNRGGGSADLGEAVSAVASGTVTEVSPGVGAVTITHKLGKNEWKSQYLHLLISDVSYKDEKGILHKKYLLKDKNGNTIKEVIPGATKIEQGEHFAAVGGTGGFSPHLHFAVFIGEKTVDISSLLNNGGVSIITGSDAGPDNNQWTEDGDKLFDVEWNKELNAYVTTDIQRTVSTNPNLVYDRTPQKLGLPGKTTPANWLAWEDGKTVGEMQVVVSKKVEYKGADGVVHVEKKWIPASIIGSAKPNEVIKFWETEWKPVQFLSFPE